MASDPLPYDQMMEAALRSVVRTALTVVAQRKVLPGDHHFYISYRSDHPDVVLPERLRARFPREITVVLQHQWYDLKVGDASFSVTLSFDGQAERLTVPFAALLAFVDPSVQFGLQFPGAEPTAEGAAKTPSAAPKTGPTLVTDGAPRPDPPKPNPSAPVESGPTDSPPKSPAQVVTLDAFRKK